ncbi:SH3 domain-containing protein [bacterium]|nr:SH3 domain-containing protein [bacterium]
MEKKYLKFYSFILIFLLASLSPIFAQQKRFKVKVVTEQANVRLKPDIGSVIIEQLPKGTVLESSGKEGSWYSILFKPDSENEVKGYVHQSLVIEMEPSPEDEPSPPPEEKKVKKKEEEKAEKEKKEETKEAQKKKEEPPVEEKDIQPPPPPVSFQELFPRYVINLALGAEFLILGDLNQGAQGLAEWYSNRVLVHKIGDVNPFHLSYALGGEMNFQLSPHFYLGVGSGYFTGGKESLVEFPTQDFTESLITHPHIQSIPIRTLITYYPKAEVFYLKAGLEYHLAQCSYSYRIQKEEYWRKWDGKATSQGLGLLGGLGITQEIFPWLNFYAEALGRYARIKGFYGEARLTDSEGTDRTEKGTLYYYKGKMAGNTYPLLFILKEKPSPDVEISDPREAQLNLSGVSLKLGIQFKF